MGLRFECDGCEAPIDQKDAKERGRLAKVFVCAECSEHIDTAARDIDAKRLALVKEFEQYRAQRLKDARKLVKKLPDE